MNRLLLIFIGCGLGGICRYAVSSSVQTLFSKPFPLGTLIVNVTGSFVMGLLVAIILERFADYRQVLSAFLLIGFLGGYTTFSSFSYETINLLEMGAKAGALVNIMLSVVLCIGAAWLGELIGRNL